MTTTATTTVSPATSGTCSVVGCDKVADFESSTRLAPSTWRVQLDCFAHAPASVLR